MCNQSNRWTRRQRRVTSWPGSLKAREVQPALAFCHSAKLSVCVSVTIYVLWVLFTVVCQVTPSIQQRKAPACLKLVQRQIRAKADRVIDCVFLPAHATSRAGIHTVWACCCEPLQRWVARGTRQRVRLVRVCTLCQCYRRTKSIC